MLTAGRPGSSGRLFCGVPARQQFGLGWRSQDSLKVAELIRIVYPDAGIVEFVKAGVSVLSLKAAAVDDLIHTIRSVAEGRKVLPHQRRDRYPYASENMLFRAARPITREHQAADLIASRMSNEQIAKELNIALHTVESHVDNTRWNGSYRPGWSRRVSPSPKAR